MNKKILLAKRPIGLPAIDDFHFIEDKIPTPVIGEVLVKTLYISVDPYMRGRMQDTKSYVAPFQLNEVITGGVIGEVVLSRSNEFTEGDFVIGTLGWQEYSVVDEVELRKIDPELAPITTHLGLLGMPGLTAYLGLLEIGKPKQGETVVVSGAAGAVGSIVGQIAKIKGAHVIGIAGSDEKTQYLKNTLGFDEAINYKTTTNIHDALKAACPNGVDIYFDNVGGDVSDAVYPLLNKFARIPLCGAISSYNKEGVDIGPRFHTTLIKSSALVQGFIVSDFAARFNDAAEQLGIWLSEGKLTYEETIMEGFENIPAAFIGLFEGKNLGKQLVKVAEPGQ